MTQLHVTPKNGDRARRPLLGVTAMFLIGLSLPPGAPAEQPAPNSLGEPSGNLPHVDHPAPVAANSAGFYGLEHTHIFSGDIDRSIHFYVDLLGFTQVAPVEDTPVNPRMDQLLGFKHAHYKSVLLNMPGGPSYGTHVPQIEIWEITGAPLDKTIYKNPTINIQGKGYNAYRVKDLAHIITRLRAAGVKFVAEPNINPVHKLPGAVYMIDPDGQVIELNNYWGQDDSH